MKWAIVLTFLVRYPANTHKAKLASISVSVVRDNTMTPASKVEQEPQNQTSASCYLLVNFNQRLIFLLLLQCSV